MKKLLFFLLCMAVFASLAMAQTYTQGTGLTGIDKLGAHQNGGRGCTGCHAPHSGSAGGGGNAGTGNTQDTHNGFDALWGQDMGPLYGQVLGFGDDGGFKETLPTQDKFEVGSEEIRGIMMCLSCHDGNIAKGAMMQNRSWEQANKLLPAGLYGPKDIPTLLANDGTAPGSYNNDHPVGVQATLGAIRVSSNFLYKAAGCGTGTKFDCLVIDTSKTSYVAFANHYGAPSIISNGHSAPVALPTTNPADAYLLCTTCHTPHSMYIASANADAPINGLAAGTYPSYFFIAAPYNPGSNPDPQHASSTTQFCRQCHFSGAGGANEASGITTVTTAF
ncbi:MAG: hypothetical protein LAO09_14295 [Acidobacteriia bacterium]|nr:hypothetical protein [Terriglobia bacterium]